MAKVALLAGWYFPESVGGTEEYVRVLARDLRALDHEVCVVAPAADEREREYEHEGIPVYRYPVSLHPTREELRGTAEPRYIEVLTKWIERERPDIVHCHSLTAGCGAAQLARVTELSLPYVVTVHTPNVVCGRGTLMRWGTTACDGAFRPVRCATCCMQQLGLPRVAAWPLAMMQWDDVPRLLPNRARTALTYRRELQRQNQAIRGALAGARQVVAVSHWLYRLLMEMGVAEEKLHLSPQGIDGAAIQQTRRTWQPGMPLRIAYVGRFDRVKGVDVLVRAVLQLPRSCAIELHLFGVAKGAEGATYLTKLRRLARDDSRIVFRGPLSTDDRNVALAQMDMVAVPSVWFETGPLVVLEAFAAGLPVLGSNQGGIAERVTHGQSGWLVPAGDVGAWAEALFTLYSRRLTGNWAWRIPQPRASVEVALEMDRLYREVLGAPETWPARALVQK